LSFTSATILDRFFKQVLHPFMTLTAVLTPAEEGGFVAFNPETGTTTQGESVPEAIQNLSEATELYLEEFPLAQPGRSLLTTFEVMAHA
jgi:predicted RNase H-like HicB family nuclease